MLPYWLLFTVFAAGAFGGVRKTALTLRTDPLFYLAIAAMLLMIGLRFETGGDWPNYDEIFNWAGGVSPAEAFAFGDPGYTALNLLAHQLGLNIWFVNFCCAALFVWGLLIFAKNQPSPWLACVVAVPYLVIVVAMGYTRQGVAIGMIMAAMVAFERHQLKMFAVYFVLALLFHKSAIAILPLIILSTTRHRFVVIVLAGVIGGVGLTFLFERLVNSLFGTYLESEMESDGAGIRVAMNLITAMIFLPAQRLFVVSEQERRLWRNFALLAVVMAVGLFVSPSTTVIDRISLYILPLQMFVLSRLPLALSKDGKLRGDVVVGLLAYLALVQFVWLNFASHAERWVPYKWVA